MPENLLVQLMTGLQYAFILSILQIFTSLITSQKYSVWLLFFFFFFSKDDSFRLILAPHEDHISAPSSALSGMHPFYIHTIRCLQLSAQVLLIMSKECWRCHLHCSWWEAHVSCTTARIGWLAVSQIKWIASYFDDWFISFITCWLLK